MEKNKIQLKSDQDERKESVVADNFDLSSKQKLLLHQLQVADYWSSRRRGEINTVSEDAPFAGLPEKWVMTRGVKLYSWQTECLEKYNGSGIAEVVTGAGKTMFALALAEKLQRRQRDLKVLIVVPTIVLLEQWVDVIARHSNLPPSAIGRLGGGYSDLLDNHPIVVGVCNSVANYVDRFGDRYKDNLFFIADECHRYRGEVMRKIFEIKRKYSLGLSATPDVDTGENPEKTEANEYDRILSSELGKIFFSLNYDDAVRAGFLPEFEICHVGLPLAGNEEILYRRISDEITRLRDRIFMIFPDAPKGGELSGWVTMKLNKGKLDEDSAAVCKHYVSKVAERKTLLYRAANREKAVVRFLQERLKKNRKSQAILFHERIEEVMHIYSLLCDAGIAAVPEHSELKESLRENSIALFRQGIAKVIVSGKALIEGFDAPAADCGINVASSGSKIQAIQSIGRILRKNGSDDTGLIVRFYIKNTTDENIYRNVDFASLTGARRNRYFFWDPADENQNIFDAEQPAPPVVPLPSEHTIDWSNVKPGSLLKIDVDGKDFQIDQHNNLFCKKGSAKEFIANPQNILELLAPFKMLMQNNYVRQSSSGRIFLRQNNDDEWSWLFCGQTEEIFQTVPSSEQELVDEFKIKSFRGKRIIQQARAKQGIARNFPEELAGEVFDSLEKNKLQCSQIFVRNRKYVEVRQEGNVIALCALSRELEF